MKLFLKYLLFVCVFVSSQSVQASNVPCNPAFELECVVEELQGFYDQLNENPEDETRFVGVAARSLFLGYAALGDFNKSERYFVPAAKYADKPYSAWGGQWPTGEVIEQMLYYKKYDDILKYLNEADSMQRCNAAIQLLSFQEEYSLLFKVLKQSDCSVSNVHSICSYVDEQQVFNLFKRLSTYYHGDSRGSDKYKIYQYEALHCLYSLSDRYRKNRKPLSYSGVVQMLNDAEIIIDYKLRKYLIEILIRDNSLEIAQSELALIEDASIKGEVAGKVIWSLINQNDKAAIQLYRNYLSNIKYWDVREEWLKEKQTDNVSRHHGLPKVTPPLSIFLLQKKFEPIDPKPRTMRRSIESSTEVKFLIINALETPEIRLQFLVEFLSNIIMRGEGDKTEFKHLTAMCKGLNYKQCVFTKITKAYKATRSIFRLNFNNSAIENKYIKANAIMANYAFLHTKTKSNELLPASLVVARHNKSCDQYLGQYIQEFITLTSMPSGNVTEERGIAVECLITNSKYKDILEKDSDMKSAIIKKLIKRLQYQPHLAYEYLQAISYDLPRDDTRKLVGRILSILKHQSAEITMKDKKIILDYIRGFLAIGDNYDYVIMSQLYRAYNRSGFDNDAADMLDKNVLFKQRRVNWRRMKTYKGEVEYFERAFNTEDLKMKALRLASKIYDKIQNEKKFSPSYPAQEKKYVSE